MWVRKESVLPTEVLVVNGESELVDVRTSGGFLWDHHWNDGQV